MLSSDEPQRSWLEFLNTNAHAHDAWCEQRRSARTQSSAGLEDLVEEIDGLLDKPCS
jgi:hypothetical protein